MRCFLSCAFCVSLSFPSVCVRIPSSWINLRKDKVMHPVVVSCIVWGQWWAEAWSPNPKSNCTQRKRKAYNFRCMFKFKKKCWKYCTLKLKEKIKYNYYCKWFFSGYLKKVSMHSYHSLFPSICSCQQLSNMEYFKNMRVYVNSLEM